MNIIITFFVFLFIFLGIIELFSVLMVLTGMENSKAKFQVVSLLTSTGYTTKESEMIVQHPIRRKIATWIMIFGYVSSVTFVSFLVNILMQKSIVSITTVFITILIIIIVIKFRKLIDLMESKIEDVIRKNDAWIKFNKYTNQLICRRKGYGIMEIYLPEDSFLVGETILSANLSKLEIQILNIDKGDKFINFPNIEYKFEHKDKLTVYGNIKNIQKLFN